MQPRLPVESTFTDFVRSFGGCVVSDILGPSPGHFNADYYFPDERVVAELKCLSEDKSEDAKLQRKVQSLFDKWMADGTIPPLYGEQVRVESKSLPVQCQRELLEVYRPPIQRRVIKANKQIKATAERLQLDPYLGLLLLVNDGNYALESNAILYQVWRILGQNFRHINNMLYFTVNLAATSPQTSKPVLVWARVSRKGFPTASENFLESLWLGWLKYLQSLTGTPIEQIRLKGVEEMEHVRYVRQT